jgi:competence protein ComEA
MSGSLPEPNEASHALDPIDIARPLLGDGLVERWPRWRRDPRLATAGLALIALAAGAWWVRLSVSGPPGAGAQSTGSPTTQFRDEASSTRPAGAPTTAAAVFVVDVVGAVRHPGVVSLPGTARVFDALTAAGGALPNAELDRINLAAHLVDGMRIAVPRRGARSDPAAPTGDGGAIAEGAGEAPSTSAPLDLNSATQAQLETLPGIGPSLAQAIIQERDREGGFKSVDELRRVRGIGDVRFAQLRGLVTV